jgi:hypothetical protein
MSHRSSRLPVTYGWCRGRTSPGSTPDFRPALWGNALVPASPPNKKITPQRTETSFTRAILLA